MHELDSTICKNADLHTSKQLIDARDNKKYWVTKLKDDNCWMTQNLDYDDPHAISVGSTSASKDQPKGWADQIEVRQYWDPGEKIAGDGNLVNYVSGTNSHLLVGNYYSWISATNGTGYDTADGEEANGSICPAGWQLPLGHPTANNTSGSLYNLLNKYGLIGTFTNNTYHIDGDPLYFQLSGLINGSGVLYVGSSGFYWASTSNNSDDAYRVIFTASTASVSNAIRHRGYSVRCLVLGS